MLTKPSANVKDLVDIRQQLTDMQSQLDSETAQRKILANETEKVAVDIIFGVDGKREEQKCLDADWGCPARVRD